MKRSWIGFALLILLLLGSLLAAKVMVDIHEPVESSLAEAAQFALEGSWEMAEARFRRGEELWQKYSHLRSCFADHNPTEQIDAAFETLKIWAAAREVTSFAGSCRSLARQVAAVGEAQQLLWWNLF